MITLEKVNQSIAAALAIAEEHKKDEKIRKHYVALLEGLRTAQNLLNRGFSEAFFEKERANVIRSINNYETARSAVGFGCNRKELLADLRAKYNPTLLTKQMGILNYILQIRASNDLDAIAEVPNKAMLYESIQAEV